MKRLSVTLLFVVLTIGCSTLPQDHGTHAQQDAVLSSWRDGPAKQRILAFVAKVCDPASASYVPPERRLAVFDMDGTLLCEKPDYIEVVITKNRLQEKAAADKSLAEIALYRAAMANDDAYIYKHVKEAILEAFDGQSLDAITTYWRGYVTERQHPSLNMAYARLFFKPMTDLMVYLQENDFSVFVVSTSQQEFIRSLSPDLLPIPRQNVVGTMVGFELANLDEDTPQSFVRHKQYFDPYNADAGKAVRLRERGLDRALIGVGNSMGDYAMLDGVSDGGLPSMVLVVDHDDPVREFEYHKPELLEAAQKRGWVVVSMKNDFRTVFE